MKRILSVLDSLPYPLIDGYKLREYHLLRNISKRWDISIICFEEPNASFEDRNHLKQYFSSLIEIPRDSAEFSLNNISKRMFSRVSQEIKNRNYDLIYVAGLSVLPYLHDYSDIPIIVDLVDDDTIKIYQKFRLEKKIINKLKFFKWWYKSVQFRNRYVPKFRNLILTSHIDADSIKRVCTNSNIYIISNGVDGEYLKSNSSKINGVQPTLCFTGVMSFEPNDDAMLYFCGKILPIIKSEYPDIKLLIIGKDPSNKLLGIAKNDKSIEITGYVNDIRPYLEKAMVYVSPLRMGSGIKNKILEAMAMSKPIVSTSIGCGGVEVEADKNIIIEDQPEKFAKAVIALLKDKEKRQWLGINGRRLIQEQYDWKSRSQNLEEIFIDVLTGC